MQTAEIAIVGAGAAGLAAAIFAAESRPPASAPARIVLLEGAKRVGAKILISGGGRCNVTHDAVRVADFHFGGSPNVVRNILRAFDEQAATGWFESLGVPLKREETGKLFPVSDQARSVLDALLRRCGELGVTLLTDHRVSDIVRQDGRFVVRHAQGEMSAARVVLATGGRSVPKTGSDGHGWEIARGLGHTITSTYPALSPLVLGSPSHADAARVAAAPRDANASLGETRPRETPFFHSRLSGISHEVELTTLVDGKPIDRRQGALLWTHFGCSGPAVLDASRFWIIAQAEGKSPQLRCNLLPSRHDSSRHAPCAVTEVPQTSRGRHSCLPGRQECLPHDTRSVPATFMTAGEADRWLIDVAAREPRRSLANVIADRLPHRVADEICAWSGVPTEQTMAQLAKEARKRLAAALTDLPLPVVGDRGWNYAEVTAGGVPLAEIDYRTMQSRVTPGLYLSGEMLDCEGRIGGFNFQWAWSTGHVAGKAAAWSLLQETASSSGG